jgi:hypothetical protein
VRSVLRDEALEPQLAGVLEDRLTVPDDVLVELDARVGDLSQEVLEPTPALLQGLNPQVDPAQLQQVEGVEEHPYSATIWMRTLSHLDCRAPHPVIVSLTVKLLEVCRAVGIAADRLSVEDQGAWPQACYRLPDEREPVRPVVAPAGEQPDPTVLLPNDHAIAAVLDLVNPVRSDRRRVSPGRNTGFDETERVPRGLKCANSCTGDGI